MTLRHLHLALSELLAVGHQAECQSHHPHPPRLLAERVLLAAAEMAAAAAAVADDTVGAVLHMERAAPLYAYTPILQTEFAKVIMLQGLHQSTAYQQPIPRICLGTLCLPA